MRGVRRRRRRRFGRMGVLRARFRLGVVVVLPLLPVRARCCRRRGVLVCLVLGLWAAGRRQRVVPLLLKRLLLDGGGGEASREM